MVFIDWLRRLIVLNLQLKIINLTLIHHAPVNVVVDMINCDNETNLNIYI